MSSSLLTVPASGLTVSEAQLQALGAAVANAETPGFGQSTPLVGESSPYAGRAATITLQGQTEPGRLTLDAGAFLASTPTAWTGTPTPTGIPTNLALTGAGFFVVRTPSGQIAYTRAGTFTPDAAGRLVLPDGSELVPPVGLPPGVPWTIGANGSVTINGSAQPSIPVALFANPAGLQSLGDSLWIPTAASGTAQLTPPGTNGAGTLVSGSVNGSGVSMSGALTNLIAAQSAYEANATALKVGQQVLQQLTRQPL